MGAIAKKRPVVVRLELPKRQRVRGHVVGHLVAIEGDRVWVDYPGNAHGRLVARSTVPLGDEVLASLATGPREALLVFEHEESDRPIVVGLMATAAEALRPAEGAPPPVARVDGRRVTLEGHDEIVLQCGEASITLRRNGRVVIRGAYVETRSRGVNRIRGGTVQIN